MFLREENSQNCDVFAHACKRCAGRGLLAIRYRDGTPWDIAICICHTGQIYRKGGEPLVRQQNPWVTAEHQVGTLEDFDEAKPIRGEVYKGA